MDVHLLVKSEASNSTRDFVLALKERIVLGRTPESPVPLEGVSISREHLALEPEGSAVYVTDLSNNGTWVNGKRLDRQQRVRLESGDAIQLPDYLISFRVPGTPVQSQPVTGTQASSVSIIVPTSTTRSVAAESIRPVEPVLAEQPKTFIQSFTVLEKAMFLLAVLSLLLFLYWMLQ